ncbi:hypothetical protein Y695_01299 [Hydrogenophaga sp. T4]|nr:hypothetical protein Y695_01299 [Hydrogenophaga sp. T4]
MKPMQTTSLVVAAQEAISAGTTPLPFDATLLFKSLQYQLLVAVEHCYDLEPGESLWLEVLGDVTIPGQTQIEVKNYSDSLTDSHANFWNTIKNWLHEDFDRTSYKQLVLLTTQEFGVLSRLKTWNNCTANERLALMIEIFAESQASALKRAEKQSDAKNDDARQSKAQSLQQYVMATKRRPALMEVLERMHIITGADSLEQRIEKYKTRHLKAIRPSKCQRFIDDMLGFIWSSELLHKGWQLTHETFSAKLTELTKQYMKHPDAFPPVDMGTLKKNIDVDEIRPMPFAQKILEIGGEHYLKRAALHRMITETTISDFYKDGVIFKSNVDLYLNNHLARHLDGRQSAMIACKGINKAEELQDKSKQFYLARHDMPIEPFCGLNNTMTEFRNGIYHMLADETPEDKDEEFLWRLWK